MEIGNPYKAETKLPVSPAHVLRDVNRVCIGAAFDQVEVRIANCYEVRPQPAHPIFCDVCEALCDGRAEEVADVEEEDGDGVRWDCKAAPHDAA